MEIINENLLTCCLLIELSLIVLIFWLHLQSLKSRAYVTEQFSWQHYYWYLTNEGKKLLNRMFMFVCTTILNSIVYSTTQHNAVQMCNAIHYFTVFVFIVTSWYIKVSPDVTSPVVSFWTNFPFK